MNEFDLLSSNAIVKNAKIISNNLLGNFYQSKTNEFGGQVYLDNFLEDYYKTSNINPATLEDNPLENLRGFFETNMNNLEIKEADFPSKSNVPKSDFLYFEVFQK